MKGKKFSAWICVWGALCKQLISLASGSPNTPRVLLLCVHIFLFSFLIFDGFHPGRVCMGYLPIWQHEPNFKTNQQEKKIKLLGSPGDQP
jgi:hypothetical protein